MNRRHEAVVVLVMFGFVDTDKHSVRWPSGLELPEVGDTIRYRLRKSIATVSGTGDAYTVDQVDIFSKEALRPQEAQ